MTPAERKLRNARARVVQAHPFFGALLLRQRVVETTDVETMATDGERLYFNPAFVDAVLPAELIGVIAHEALHPALCHHLRRGDRDHRQWNEACVRGSSVIAMADGSRRQIKDIVAGDVVASPRGANPVAKVTLSAPKRMLEFVIGNRRLGCSDEHKIFTARGWVRADALEPTDLVALDAGIQGGDRGALPVEDNRGAGGAHWQELSTSRRLPLCGRVVLDQEDDQARELARHLEALGDRLGIHRGDHRRRGYGLGRSARTALFQASRHDRHNHLSVGRILRALWLLWGVRDEFGWAHVLAGDDLGFLSSGFFEGRTTAPNHQARARGAADRAMRSALERSLASADAPEDVRDLLDHPRLEYARVTVARRLAAPEPLFDLITARGCYAADGVIVHNCDYAINPILVRAGLTLPAGALIDPRFDGKGAEAIYPMLDRPRSNAQGGQDGAEGAGTSRGQPMPRPGDGSGRQVPSFGGTGAVIDAPVRDEADRATQEAEWHIALAQAAAAAGGVDGQLRSMIDAELAPRLDWRALLRRYVQQVARDDYTWAAPNRRFVADGLYLPSLRSEKLGPALFVVDASGSMSDEALAIALAEVRAITEDCGIERLDVAVHDTRVTSTHSFEPGDEVKVDVLGRGGTRFAPVVDHIDARDERPSVVVWFTDLEASDWSATREPDAPVLWLQYGGAEYVPPFGDEVVRMEG